MKIRHPQSAIRHRLRALAVDTAVLVALLALALAAALCERAAALAGWLTIG